MAYRRRGRIVVECVRLESEYIARCRGFESRLLRQDDLLSESALFL